MPLDWLNTPLDADIGELLARKKRAKAIESLRRQLQGRMAPPVTVRLQLADLLMQAGRIEEAVPVLLGLADEFANDGFVAKAVAILKRVDRVQPGRADIAERLEKLVHQQKRVSNLPAPTPRPMAAPEFGMEEIGEGNDLLAAAEAELAAAREQSLPVPSVEPGLAAPAGFDEAVELPSEPMSVVPEVPSMAAEIEVEEAAVEPPPPLEPPLQESVEPSVEPSAEPMSDDEVPASPADPVVDVAPLDVAPLEALEPIEPGEPGEPPPLVDAVSPSDAVADLVADEPAPPMTPSDETAVSVDAAGPGEVEDAADLAVDAAGGATGEGTDAGATGPGVGRRIRRALWRFLASLPGTEEGAPGATGAPGAEAEPLPGEVAAGDEVSPSPDSPVEEPAPIEAASSDAAAAEPALTEGPPNEPPPSEPPPSEPSPSEPHVTAPPVAEAPPLEPPPPEPMPAEPAIEPAIAPAVAEAADKAPPAADVIAEAPRAEPQPDVAARVDAAPAIADVEPTPALVALEPPVSSPEIESDDALLGVMEPPGEDAMSEETFRQNLLDIVEDVLHRPPSPETAEAADRARVLDLARRMVASRLFKDLSDEELLAIVRGLRLHTYEAGDIVVSEGEPGQSLFTLSTGRVKVFVENPDHRSFEVAALSEGDFFGEISSLSGRPRTATVVAETICELLELDRPTLDSIARTHARVRDVLESSYIARASSPEAAAVRAVPLPDSGTRKASEILESHFGESRWDPRMRLRLADVLIKAGKAEDAISILVGLADELAREGYADKAVAIIKKIEQVQRRHVEVMNLAPLLKPDAASPRPQAAAGVGAAPPRPRAVTDDRFHGWLVDIVRDTVGKPRATPASAATPAAPVLKAYGPGLLANPLFEDFSEEELVAFIHGLKLLSFEPGDVIITEGEAGQSVFILATGEVKVFVRGPDKRNVMLSALGEGSFFGEISTLSGRPRTATITAAAACEILELDRAALEAISATHPRVRTVLETFSAARSADPEAARARGERPSA